MQAIETTYHGPTNSRGSRVIAKCQAGRISVSWDHALDVEANHDAAAVALVRKLGWGPTQLLSGGRPDGKGNVYILADSKRLDVGITPRVKVTGQNGRISAAPYA